MPQAPPDRHGRIILLNGASSAGKSSIAHELQQRFLPQPLLRFGLDEFMHFLPQRFFAIEPEPGHPAQQGLQWRLPLEPAERQQVSHALNRADVEPLAKYETLQKVLDHLGASDAVRAKGVQIVCGSVIDQTVWAMHRTAAQLAQVGNDVVIEHAFLEAHWLKDCRHTLAECPVLWVGLKPPLEVLERRELERGFRVMGQTKGHYDLIHRDIDYSLVLDTATLNPKECAETIIASLSKPFGT